MRSNVFRLVLLVCVAAPLLVQGQNGLKRLLTQPTEKVVFTQPYRDWGLIALAGDTVISAQPGESHALYAFDAATGKLKWKYRAPAPVGDPGFDRPAVIGNLAITSYGRDYDAALIAVNIATGKETWRKSSQGHYRAWASDGPDRPRR